MLALPAGSHHFEIVSPADGAPAQVKVTLVSLAVPAPSLRPAAVTPDGTLAEAPGQVALHFPDLLLVVTASTSPPSSARLAPATDAAGALELTMTPSAALIGPGTVAGFGFQTAALDLDAPGGAQITVPDATVYVSPPGIPALAMQGGGNNITWPLGSGQGLSGEFTLTAAGGAAGAAARPRFLENVAAHVVLDRGSVTLLECSGDIDVAKEVGLRVGPLGDPPSKLHYRLGSRWTRGGARRSPSPRTAAPATCGAPSGRTASRATCRVTRSALTRCSRRCWRQTYPRVTATWTSRSKPEPRLASPPAAP